MRLPVPIAALVVVVLPACGPPTEPSTFPSTGEGGGAGGGTGESAGGSAGGSTGGSTGGGAGGSMGGSSGGSAGGGAGGGVGGSSGGSTGGSAGGGTGTGAPDPLPKRTFYVAPNGSDSNAGTITQPWKTIQHAAAQAVAGDKIYLRGGTYREVLKPSNSGDANNPITFAAYQTESPILDLSASSNLPGIVEIKSKSYIRVIGLTLKNNLGLNGHGMYINSSHHIKFIGNKIFNIGSSGIRVANSKHRAAYVPGDEDVIIEANELVDTNLTILESANQARDESISIVQSNNWVVRFNVLRMSVQTPCKSPTGANQSCGKEAIDAKEGSSHGRIHSNHVLPNRWSGPGIYVDAWDSDSRDIEIYGNRIEGRKIGIAVSGERCADVEKVRIYNNIISDPMTGIRITNWPLNGQCAPLGMKSNISIVNNTVVGAAIGIQVDDTPRSGFVVRNNILQTIGSQNPHRQGLRVDGGLQGVVVDHNLVHGLLPNSTAPDCRNASVCADPRFISLSDYHLTSASPAIDQGGSMGAPGVDFDGTMRPQGSAIDMGAYEFK